MCFLVGLMNFNVIDTEPPFAARLDVVVVKRASRRSRATRHSRKVLKRNGVRQVVQDKRDWFRNRLRTVIGQRHHLYEIAGCAIESEFAGCNRYLLMRRRPRRKRIG